MTSSTPVRAAALATSALLAVALCACGGDDTRRTDAPPATSSSSSASPSPSPTDAAELLQQATDALRDAETVRLTGTIADDDESFDLDISYGADGEAVGTLDDGSGATVEVRIVDGTTYAKGSQGFYDLSTSSDDTPTDYSGVADRWVVVDESAPPALSGVGDLFDRDSLADDLADNDSEGLELSGPEDVEGTSAYIITNDDGDTFAVAAEGDPRPVRVGGDGDDDQGEIVFEYDVDVDVEAPDDSEIVELPA